MKIKHLLNSLLMAMISLSISTGTLAAQQPFGSNPGTGEINDTPSEDSASDILKPNQDDLPRRDFEGTSDKDTAQGQLIVLNSKYAGWEEAAAIGEADRVGTKIRGNWVMVDSNGRFEGTVVAGAGADIANTNVFLMNMGRLVKQTTINSEGRFEFNNVRQGAYSLVGWGDKAFFAFGVNILAHNPEGAGKIQNKVNITAFQNASTINTDWIRYYSSRVNFRVFGRYETGEGRDDPAAMYGFMGLVRNLPESTPATSISSHPVSKTADGRLVGRVHQLNSLNGRPVDVRTTKVMLFQGDDVVASTTTDNFGVFEFQGVPDGNFGLAAAGVDGVGLISINVGSANSAMNDMGEVVGGGEPAPIDFTLVSAETVGWLNHYANEVAYRRALLAPRPQRPAPQMAGNGMCPSCGNLGGGCSTCQNAYTNSCCSSRGITFEQWQQMGCQCQGSSQLGNGRIIADVAGKIRKNMSKVDEAFDRAFYSNEYNGSGINGAISGGNGFQGQPLMQGQPMMMQGQPMMQQPYFGN